jgi:L-threonylcarbamoyladenylate synthase
VTDPRIIDLRGAPDRDLSEVAAHLRDGGLVAYPTETVYGLGGSCEPDAVAALRRVKRRDGQKPFIVLVESVGQIERLHWSEEARTLASIFWPGSVTLILPDPEHVFPVGVRSESGAVAVRVSPHEVARRLVHEFGAPITSTSLNAPGRAPARSLAEAINALADLAADDVILLDAGALPPSGPSTVIDCTTETPVVVREGAVPVHRLRCAIPEIHGQSN